MSDRAFLLGEGLFETLLVRSGEPQDLDAHLARMRTSAQTLGLPCPADLAVRVHALTADACAQADVPARAAMRISLGGGGGRGLVAAQSSEPVLRVGVTPLPDTPDLSPLVAVTVRAHRVDPAAALSGHKTLSWMPWIAARREALARGAHVALVSTVEGDLCEADHANVFLLVADTVVTPALDRGVLPGITRARALSVLRSAGREVSEQRVEAADACRASEIWLTSSLDGVRSLSSLDGRALSAPGRVATWLADCMERP